MVRGTIALAMGAVACSSDDGELRTPTDGGGGTGGTIVAPMYAPGGAGGTIVAPMAPPGGTGGAQIAPMTPPRRCYRRHVVSIPPSGYGVLS